MSIYDDCLKANKPILDLCGVSAWQDAGYTGGLGMIGTWESFNPALIPDSVNLNDNPTFGEGGDHPYKTAMTARAVCPDAKIVCLETGLNTDYGENGRPVFSGPLADKTPKYIQDNKVDCVFRSRSSKSNSPEPLNIVMDVCSFFVSAGNYAEGGYNKLMENGCWFGVGAVALKDGKVTTEPYTSWDDEVDFAGFANIMIPSTGTVPWVFDGTSCATPWIAGQAHLVNQIMLEKAGYPLSAAQMYAYLKAHSVDVDAAGRDVRTGWGYIRLPKPEDAERELFNLTRQKERLYAQMKARGIVRNDARFYLDLVRDWRLPD